MTELLGWRTVFVVEVLVGIAAIALSAAVMTESRHTGLGRIEPRLLAGPGLSGAMVASLLLSAAAFAPLVYHSLWIYFAGLGPGAAAALTLALVAPALATSAALSRVLRKSAAWIWIGLGLAVVGMGALWKSDMDSSGSLLSHTLGLLITGIGVGLCMPSIRAAVSAAVPDERRVTAATALHISIQIGLALGTAVLDAVYAMNLNDSESISGALNSAMLAAGWIALIGAVPAAFLVSRSRLALRPAPGSRSTPSR